MSAAEMSNFDDASTVLLRENERDLGVIARAYSDHYITEFPKIDQSCSKKWSARLVTASEIPDVEPGQLWFVELPAGAELSLLERRALTSANVVIYDRTLADAVAAFLPLGAYAEPAVPTDPLPDQSLDRCLRFVLDGWSVVRLIDSTELPRHRRVEQIRRLSERLVAAQSPSDQPILMLVATEDDSTLWKTDVRLGALGAAIADCSFDDRLALVFAAVGARSAPSFSIASANGLAG
jgi:hypothetical protein